LAIEFFSHSDLSTFELGDFDSTPTLGSADKRAEHQLQNSSLAKGVGNDLEAAALLDEQAFKQIRRADRPAMGHRELRRPRARAQARLGVYNERAQLPASPSEHCSFL
jgi:hypothetical protein